MAAGYLPPPPPPAAAAPGLDFGRALRFVVEDPDWVRKVVLGGLFWLLGSLLIGLPFLGGYFVRLIQRTARGEARPLPDWDDLGGTFVLGLRVLGVYLAYLFAAMLVPAGIGCTLAAMGGGFARLSGGEGGAEALIGLGIVLFYGVLLVLGLLFMVYVPAAVTRFALSDRFDVAFQVRENVEFIRRNLGGYLLALVLYLVASFVAQFGLLLCCVGFFPASFWAFCILGYALGEVARADPALAAAR